MARALLLLLLLLLLIIKAMAMLAMAIFDSACQLRSGTRVKQHSIFVCVRARQRRCDICDFWNLNKPIIVHSHPIGIPASLPRPLERSRMLARTPTIPF